MGWYGAGTRWRRPRSGGRRCGALRHARRRGDERIGQLQVDQVLATLLCRRSVTAEQDRPRGEPPNSYQHVVSSPRSHVGSTSVVRAVVISATVSSRILNFCTFPVTVIGNSSVNRMYRGIL